MKQLFFDGRLGGDVEVKTSTNGQEYIRFNVANSVYSKVNGERVEKTDWIEVVCFDPTLIKNKVQVLKKGNFVLVVGDLEVSSHTLQDGRLFINQRVIARSIDIPSVGKPREDNNGNVQEGTQRVAAPQQQYAQPQMAQQMPAHPQYTAQPQAVAQPQYSAQVPTYQQPQMAQQMPAQPQYQTNVTVDNDLPF